ncbi:hypothetical protein AURDEDRAFT_181010 [Auricularia subglabra TFB-10046 SS5]|nr:hypothetical protein AURDEDRAFT_181010 [Auricularia subglabra TFB-10046 SS5]
MAEPNATTAVDAIVHDAGPAEAKDAPPMLEALPVELVCRSLWFLPFHDLLAATYVCRAWREVALAEPSLWTNIRLNGLADSYGRSHRWLGDAWPYPSFLDDLLDRSRNAPVHLEIRELSRSRLLVFCETVRRHMHHLSTLRVHGVARYSIRSDELPTTFARLAAPQTTHIAGTRLVLDALHTPGPFLEELSIHAWDTLTLTGDFFTRFPRLRRLLLRGWGVGRHLTARVPSVVYVAIDGSNHSGRPPMPDLFAHFPGMRELELEGVGRRNLRLPVMGPLDTLQRLAIIPVSSNWQYSDMRAMAPQRIAHIAAKYPSATLCRGLLASLPSIETIELTVSNVSGGHLGLHAHTADGTMSRTLNAICLRVLGGIFEGWQTTCYDAVSTVSISDKLPWEDVLPFLSAMRSVQKLTFLVSARTDYPIKRDRKKVYDAYGSSHLFDQSASEVDLALCPNLALLQSLRFSASEPVPLTRWAPLGVPDPDEVGLGGWAAHRVSAALVRAMLTRFRSPLDLLVFDGVVIREGADSMVMSELAVMVKSLVVHPPL